MDNNPFSMNMNWMNSWTELQKKMWGDWSSLMQSTGLDSSANPFSFLQKSMGETPFSPWAAFSPFQAMSSEELASRSMMSAMTNFMNMSKGVFETFQKISDRGSSSAEEWTAELDKNLNKFREFFASASQTQFSPFNPMGSWNSMLQNVPMFSSDLMKQYMGGAMPNMENNVSIDGILGMPGLGLMREKQEKVNKAIKLGMDYQKVMGEFQSLQNQAKVKAVDLFREKLIALAKEGKPLESLRDLHVVWVDANEETNAEMVSSKEYQELNPRMAEALLTLRGHIQEMTDDFMGALNLPNRRELNSAYKQIHTLRRKVRELEAQAKTGGQGDSSKLNRLREDVDKMNIDDLRKDVEDLKKQLADANNAAKAKATNGPAAIPAAKKGV